MRCPQAEVLVFVNICSILCYHASSTLTTQSRFGGFAGAGPAVKTRPCLPRNRERDQRKISQESAFLPHGQMVSFNGCNSVSTVPWGTREQASLRGSERLGKRNLYRVSSSIHRASSFDEPRTLLISRGSVRKCYPEPSRLFHHLLKQALPQPYSYSIA